MTLFTLRRGSRFHLVSRSCDRIKVPALTEPSIEEKEPPNAMTQELESDSE